MKAAVLHQLGTNPRYEDFNAPVPQNDQQVLVNVKASALHNLDKFRASGNHYASYSKSNLPTAAGFDGVGITEKGIRIYAPGITGMMAEKAIVEKNKMVKLPDKLDFNIAAALPNATLGAAMPLLYRAKLQQGETVLINGATGVTGNMAVQLARHYGASKIIATGRNIHLLKELKEVGASETISLEQNDEAIIEQLQTIHRASPINLVIDYLWGKPVELILQALKGGDVNAFTKRVRLVTFGEMAGASIDLPSGFLRSAAIEILGSGIGSLSKEDMADYSTKILPEIFQLASDGKIGMNIQSEKLENVEKVWSTNAEPGHKVVFNI